MCSWRQPLRYGCFDDTTVTVEVYPYIFAKFTIDKPAICSDEPFTIDRTSLPVQSIITTGNTIMQVDPDGEKSDPLFNYTYFNKHSMPLKLMISGLPSPMPRDVIPHGLKI